MCFFEIKTFMYNFFKIGIPKKKKKVETKFEASVTNIWVICAENSFVVFHRGIREIFTRSPSSKLEHEP